jgi:hypothetical protein
MEPYARAGLAFRHLSNRKEFLYDEQRSDFNFIVTDFRAPMG